MNPAVVAGAAGAGFLLGLFFERWVAVLLADGKPHRPVLLAGVNAALFALAASAAGSGARSLSGMLLFGLLLVASVTDLRQRIIPNPVVLAGLVAALTVEALARPIAPVQSLLGAVVAGGFLWILEAASGGGVGRGDVKLAAVMGLVLGPGPAVVALLLAFALGATGSALLLAVRRVGMLARIPFGPFLMAGGVVAFLAGAPLIHWYLAIIRA